MAIAHPEGPLATRVVVNTALLLKFSVNSAGPGGCSGGIYATTLARSAVEKKARGGTFKLQRARVLPRARC